MASSINMQSILRKTGKTRKLKQKIEKTFGRRFQKLKQRTIERFDTHPVTKELEAGPSANNTSGTLGGYGNLFSFIGFTAVGNPTSSLRKVIRDTISYTFTKSLEIPKSRQIIFNYRVRVPSREEIRAVTPKPWEGGSWVDGIEHGMSSFSYYMYKRFEESRSGWGLQSDHELRKAIFFPKDYVTGIMNTFKREVRTIR